MEVQWITVHMLCRTFKWLLFFRCSKQYCTAAAKNTCLIELVSGSHEPQASCFLLSPAPDGSHHLSSLGHLSGVSQCEPSPPPGRVVTDHCVVSGRGDLLFVFPYPGGPPPSLSSPFLPPWEPQLLFYSMKREPLNTETVLPHFWTPRAWG